MAARVIHLGPDDCHRLMVLRSAGYSVETCGSLGQLRASLEAGVMADAVFMSDGDGVEPLDAISMAKTHSSAPVVLFRSNNRTFEDSTFDLVVPILTPPEVWLNDVDALIAKSRSLRTASRLLTEESAHLQRDVKALVIKSRAERGRSRQECARNGGPSRGDQPPTGARPR